MGEAKFTPGPWHAFQRVTPQQKETWAVGEPFRGGLSPTIVPDATEADAHLIAAAPSLYEALEKVLYSIPFVEGEHPYAEAQAALAKARGDE